jgi:hypothetical protein
MHLQAARPAGRPAAASPPPSRGAALSESGSPAGVQACHRQPDPALRRGHDLHARLRPRPGEPLRHLPPLAIQRAGQVPRVLPAGMASPGPVRISGLTASHAVPQHRPRAGPPRRRCGEHIAATQRGAQLLQDAQHVGVPAHRFGGKVPAAIHRAAGWAAIGCKRWQAAGSSPASGPPGTGAQEKIGGESLSEAADHAARSHCPARPRARPEPLTCESDGRPGKARGLLPVTGCRRSP